MPNDGVAMWHLGDLTFSFMLHTDLRFGAGEVRKLPEHIRRFGWRNVALVIDAGPLKNPAWQAVQGELEREFTITARLETAVTEPTYDYLNEVRVPFMDKAIDGFVVMGGGSVMDVGKALSVLVTNRRPAIEYRGFDLATQPGPPIIAIPTTAGTGSEVTPNAVFIDTRENRKFGINTTLYIPKLCILDPQLTVSCPRHATISSGADALVHAHESFVSKRANPITRPLATEAFQLVFNSFRDVMKRPDDLESRGRLQLGSYLAAVALFNSSAGPAGAMSYPLGVHHHVPHGVAGAVFLPRVIEHNVERGYDGYGPLYASITGSSPVTDPIEAGRRLAEEFRRLWDELGIPRSLDRFGFTRRDIPDFARQAQLLQGAFDMNPVPFTMDDVRVTLEAMTPATGD